MLKLEKRYLRDIAVFDLEGALNASSQNEFWELISTEVVDEGARKLLLNCAGLTLIDSAGLSEVLRIHKSVGNIGGKMVLFNLNGLVQKVIEITNLSTILNIEADEAAAVLTVEVLVAV